MQHLIGHCQKFAAESFDSRAAPSGTVVYCWLPQVRCRSCSVARWEADVLGWQGQSVVYPQVRFVAAVLHCLRQLVQTLSLSSQRRDNPGSCNV